MLEEDFRPAKWKCRFGSKSSFHDSNFEKENVFDKVLDTGKYSIHCSKLKETCILRVESDFKKLTFVKSRDSKEKKIVLKNIRP